ncbi:Dol-P-Glc:Glc(2)Man(9)GlcNAc(2)-PP-Dol alpha-1 [Chlorella vulgaris]
MPDSSGQAALAAVLLSVAVVAAALVAKLAPEPYMDEPFHVPQTQAYCAGRWREWDPKITTFPGLYVFGAALGHAVAASQRLLPAAMLPALPLCSTTVLRSASLLFAAACLPLFHHAARQLDVSRSQRQLNLMAAACFLFPLHFFFSVLYYTDVPSLFFTLAAYLAAQQQRHYLAAALGAAAVAVRQTNAVWVAFTLGTAVLARCQPAAGDHGDGGSSSSGNSSGRGGGRRPPNRSRQRAGWLADLRRLLRQVWLRRGQLAGELGPLAAVVTAFAAFVVVNGGVVVGDKAHHVPVRHLAQPLYFLLYCTAWLAPVFWSPQALMAAAQEIAATARRQPARSAATAAAAAAAASGAVARGTLAHPFLLADNRHYTFYIWRRLIDRSPWSRYALIPAYLYAGWAVQRRLAHRDPLWLLGLAGATCLVLVPAHLLEFRYFSTPFYLVFLHMRTPSPRALAVVVASFAAVNAATLYVYLYHPFAWADGSVARFMW